MDNSIHTMTLLSKQGTVLIYENPQDIEQRYFLSEMKSVGTVKSELALTLEIPHLPLRSLKGILTKSQ